MTLFERLFGKKAPSPGGNTLSTRLALERISKNGVSSVLKIKNEIAALDKTRKVLLERVKVIANSADDLMKNFNIKKKPIKASIQKIELDKCNKVKKWLKDSEVFILRSLASCENIESALSKDLLDLSDAYKSSRRLWR